MSLDALSAALTTGPNHFARQGTKETMNNPIICVDFDGVIHSYSSGWKGVDIIPDDPVPGAIEWLMDHLPMPDGVCAMADPYKGPEVQIYSSRSKESAGIKAMKAWLIKHGMRSEYITEGILKFPTQKPAAFLTIDDRAICFNGSFPTAQEMMSFKPWNKRDYPEGRLTPEDEGTLAISIGEKNGVLVVEFGKPTEWIGLPPHYALEFAALLHRRAAAMIAQH